MENNINVHLLASTAPDTRSPPHHRPACLHSRVHGRTQLWEVQRSGDVAVLLLLLL